MNRALTTLFLLCIAGAAVAFQPTYPFGQSSPPSAGSGTVILNDGGVIGVGANTRVAVYDGVHSIKGDSSLSWDGGALSVSGNEIIDSVGILIGSRTQNGNGDKLDITKNAYNLVEIEAFGAEASSAFPDIHLARADGTRTSPTVVQSGDTLGQISFSGQPGTTLGATNVGACIIGRAAETWSTSANGTNIELGTLAIGAQGACVKKAVFSNAGDFTPATTNTGKLGTSSLKWNEINGTTLKQNGSTVLTSVPFSWSAGTYYGNATSAPPANTTLASFKTGSAGATLTDMSFVVVYPNTGNTATGTATIDLTDTSGNAQCSMNLTCTGNPGAITSGSCSNIALTASTRYEFRMKTQCGGTASFNYGNAVFGGTVP